MLTASSSVFPVPFFPDASFTVRDSDDKKYRMALDMMQVQCEKEKRLTSDLLVELENARADMTVANTTVMYRNISFHIA